MRAFVHPFERRLNGPLRAVWLPAGPTAAPRPLRAPLSAPHAAGPPTRVASPSHSQDNPA